MMTFNKITAVLMILVASVFVIGASKCSLRGPDADDTTSAPFFGGTKGIEAKLLVENQVSDSFIAGEIEVWDEDSFPVEVELTNEGEHPVKAHEVKLEIKGISPSDFSGIDFTKDNSQDLEEVSEFLPEGGIEYIDFGSAKYNNLVGNLYDATFFVFFTYPYKTYIHMPKVCYKYDLKDKTVCNVNGPKQALASAGPFAVGTVQQRYAGLGKIMLEIPVKNVQKGRSKSLSGDEFKANFDEFRFAINDADWDCTSRGSANEARISHPSGTPSTEEVIIRCVNNNLGSTDLFPRGITLELDYYYQDWVEQTVRIKKTPS